MKSPRTTSPSPDSERSLFGEILDWMLAPLLFVWPLSIAITHYFASNVASFPYDQGLREHVATVARQIKFASGKPVINLPGSARAFLRADETDTVYFHVVNQDGTALLGDSELPVPAALEYEPDRVGEIFFRDTEFNGEELRVAYSYLADTKSPRDRWVLIEVGETLEKRTQLGNKIVASVILPQFIIIPVAVILVWFGLSRGLRPLNRLRKTLETRAPADLSPIATRRVPEELEPLVEAFNDMLDRMRRSVEVQQRFVADASHQLRTPLTGLKTQAQFALRETDPETLRHALGQIAAGVDRASRLVNQLLTLARTEGTELVQKRQEPVDLVLLVRDLVADSVGRALERGIDLGFEAVDQAMVMGNPVMLRELAANLVDNAIRYTPDRGQVTCRVKTQASRVILEIEDNGIGISEDDAELVFERFYRVNDAASEGSGLGLAIVREIALQHDASASLRPSSSGIGSVAKVVFPAWVPPPEPLPPPDDFAELYRQSPPVGS